MKKIAVVTALLVTLTLTVAVKPASARHHAGHFWGGFAAGTATGLVFGTLVAPRYEYAPAPVYVYPPQPVCRDYYTQGYWRQVPVMDPAGFTTYGNEWVPASTQRVCQ